MTIQGTFRLGGDQIMIIVDGDNTLFTDIATSTAAIRNDLCILLFTSTRVCNLSEIRGFMAYR